MKIFIEENAKKYLEELLLKNNYNCINLEYKNSCCKKIIVDIVLDNLNDKNEVQLVDTLTFTYNPVLKDMISSISLKYENNNLMMKISPKNHKEINCNCKNKGNCNNCSKQCSK